MALFGSILRDDFRPDSDVDLLVTFKGEQRLKTILDISDELAVILGRPIDLIPKKAIMNDRNYLRRKMILNSTQVIYAA